MRNGRPEGDFSLELAYLVKGSRSKVVEAKLSGPRNLPRAVFEVGKKSYSLTYEPATQALIGDGVSGRYFPDAVADRIDGVLGTNRVIDRSGLLEGRSSRYLWADIQPGDLEKIKIPLRAVRSITNRLAVNITRSK